MADQQQKSTSALVDKRLELAIRSAELQLEVLKLNRELLNAGHSVTDLQNLGMVAFCW